ncbi:MAG TPA: helix-hairpin-helix domain-containing protein, partial [Candidatus Poseidoniaceae archaeon]|nr:helix-hairpin-helix domain-containing protein [Candidatus Poseidoniaceae archaeon]
SLPNIGRKRARDLANMGVYSPKDFLDLTSRDKSRLLALPGWGPKLIERVLKRIKKERSEVNEVEKRRDDEPLPGEK